MVVAVLVDSMEWLQLVNVRNNEVHACMYYKYIIGSCKLLPVVYIYGCVSYNHYSLSIVWNYFTTIRNVFV